MFSKSSIQLSHIPPRTPQLVDFNDYAAVGNYRRDPRLNIIRYSLDGPVEPRWLEHERTGSVCV